MVIAKLLVELEANSAKLISEMEKAAHHVEMTGRRITRAGLEITKVFAPLAALYAGALTAAVKQSEIVHGQLAQAWDRLVLSGRLLLRELGEGLTPAFLKTIANKEALIEKARQLVAWFEHLSPATQSLIVKFVLFLAALGPTIVIIGSLIRAAGALWMILSQLATLIGGVIVEVFAFLLSPVGLITLGIIALIGALYLLIRHWELVKDGASVAWNFMKILVLDAIDKILSAFEQLAIATGWDSMVDKIEAVRDHLGVLKLEAERAEIAARKLWSAYHTPLLPDWLTSLPATIKGLFTLPAVPPLPSLQILQAQDALAKLQTQLQENAVSARVLGSSFDLAAANASAYKATIDELLKLGIKLDDVLDKHGTSLRKLGALYKGFSADAKLQAGILAAANTVITNSFVALGDQLGQIFAGLAHGFHGFGKVMEGILGAMLSTLGKVLIAYGVAGLAIRHFVISPGAAIAAGVALVALGSALSAAASNTVSGAGGGGGAVPAGATPSADQASQGPGTIYLELHGDGVVGALFADPRNQDALAQALRDLSGRNVEVVPVMG